MLFLAQFTIRTVPYMSNSSREEPKLRLVEADNAWHAEEKLRAFYERGGHAEDSVSINIDSIENAI